jgi:hypothetical protein
MFVFIVLTHDVTEILITHPLRGQRPADYHPAPDRNILSLYIAAIEEVGNTKLGSFRH